MSLTEINREVELTRKSRSARETQRESGLVCVMRAHLRVVFDTNVVVSVMLTGGGTPDLALQLA